MNNVMNNALKPEMKHTNFCECGCGDLAKLGKRFINGHNKGNTGKHHSEKTKKLMGLWQKGKTNSERYGLDRVKEISCKLSEAKKGKKRKPFTEETIEKMKLAKLKAHREGKYNEETKKKISQKIQNVGDNKKYKTGYFIDRFGNSHYFASSFEEKRMIFLDSQEINFQKKHDHTFMWYDDNNKSHAYTPDLLIENKTLEEIKPEYKLNDRDVILKAIAAKEYCKNNNLSYRIVTENTLRNTL